MAKELWVENTSLRINKMENIMQGEKCHTIDLLPKK